MNVMNVFNLILVFYNVIVSEKWIYLTCTHSIKLLGVCVQTIEKITHLIKVFFI